MNPFFTSVMTLFKKTPLIILFIAVFLLGFWANSGPTSGDASKMDHSSHASETSETIWTCSMHPQIQLPEPGPCPLCGMDLIPMEKEKVTSTTLAKKKPKYACSMFCTPSMDEPGKCPICGMDMVEVSDDMGSSGMGAMNRPTLTLSPAAAKLAEIRVAPVERKFVSAQVRMVGKVVVDETRLGYITAWIPGRLDRLYADYTGMTVQKGEHLAEYYSPQLYSTQEELIQAIRSTKDLAHSDIAGLRNSAQASVEDVRERLRLWGMTPQQIADIEKRGKPSDHMTFHAPIGGVIIHKDAVEGMYVKTGTRIYTIADLSKIWVKLDAYESDLVWVRYGQNISFTTDAYPGETFHGQIAFIDPVINPKTRTVKVRVNVDNADGRLKPNMLVRAIAQSMVAGSGKVMDPKLAGKWMCSMHPEIVSDHAGECDLCGMFLKTTEELGYVSIDADNQVAPLVIPASAPLITGKRAVVYVALPDKPGTYEGRQVVLGPRAGDYYLVKEGLAEGDMVVVNGNFKIDSAMQIRALPSMMNPTGGVTTTPHHHESPGGHDMGGH